MIKKIKKIDSGFNIANYSIDGKKNNSYCFQKSLEKSLNFGYYLITPLILGVLLGSLLNEYFNVKIFLKILFLIGVIGTFYNLFKIVKENK